MRRKAWVWLGVVVVLALWWGEGGWAGQGSREAKQALVRLITQQLAGAYEIGRPGQLPDFSTLDEIFPSWDGGKPAAARRRWLEGHYSYYRVRYQVFCVEFTSGITARVSGRREVVSVRIRPLLKFFESSQAERRFQRFVIEAYLTPRGWRIRRELLY